MTLMLIVLIVSTMPSLAWIVWKKLGVEKAKYLSLLVIVPSLVVLSDFLTCSVRSLEEWYWVNCGLTPLERLFVALTMPSVVVPLSALALVLVGLKEARGEYFYLATALSLSLAFYWSIYLDLNAPLLYAPPKLPPLGYGVVRAFPFFTYLLLYSLGTILVFSFIVSRKLSYLKIGLVLEVSSLFMVTFWGLYGFGAPLPLTLYHLGLWFTFLSSLGLLHDGGNLSAYAFLSSLLVTMVLPRLYPIGFGGMPSPFFALQSSIGVAYLILIAVGAFELIKRPLTRRSRIMIGIEVSTLIFALISVFDYASNLLFLGNPVYTLYALLVPLGITSVNLALAPYLINKDKIYLLSPVTLLHPLLGAAGNLLIPVYYFIKSKSVLRALMVASSISIALLILYGSTLYLITPYAGSHEVTFEKELNITTNKYKGNVTILNYHYIYKLSVGKTNKTEKIEIPLTIRINVFMNKYIAPNEPTYFSWSTPQLRGLSTCSLSARSFLGKPTPNVDYFYLVCAPLGAEGIVAPSLSLLVLLLSLRKTSKTRRAT